ncbi:hypothetical protein Hanom_Chr03g00222361 [Helianthus anomalus]
MFKFHVFYVYGIRISILLIFAYLMVDVAPWRHGGDGAGDPPPPVFLRGTHETDGVPPKRVRGNAKNEKLRCMVKACVCGGGGGIAYI